MTFHKSALFTFFLLMCYGLGLLLIYTHQNEEKWIPKVSFNLPTFMYTNHLNSQTQKATQSEDNPLPQPNLSLTPQKSLVLFSKKPLKQQTLVQPLTLETNAASLYKKDYAVQPNQAKIVLIISNLGVDEEVLNKAMATLPENVTLSFSTYSPNLEEKIKAARQEGFETMLNIAIETKDFPKHDPGNNAFYTFASDEENINILNHLYTQKIPFIGFLSPRPSHFETTSFFQKLIQNEIFSKGLIYVGTTPFDFPSKQAFTIDLSVVKNLYPEALHVFFNEAIAIAKDKGKAILVFSPLPVVFDEIANWIAQNQDKTIQFVPMGSLLEEEQKNVSE